MTEQHSRAGKARLIKMTPERRSEVARAGAMARWHKADPSRKNLPHALYGAASRPLLIGEMGIPCYVLDDERRILASSEMMGAMGMSQGDSLLAGLNQSGILTTKDRVRQYVFDDVGERIRRPVHFITPTGARSEGYEAKLLVDVCEAVIVASASQALWKHHLPIVQSCEAIIQSLAGLDIGAMVDRTTGYHEVRTRDALHRILDAHFAPEIGTWAKRFPDGFFREMFRLREWDYDPGSVSRPGMVAEFIQTYVFEQLTPRIIEELQSKGPGDDKERKKVRYHQALPDDVGHPHLERQITATVTLMRASDNLAEFKRLFARAFPKPG